MKTHVIYIIISLIIGCAISVNDVAIRSPILEVIDGEDYNIDAVSFPGLFLNENTNLGNENLKIEITEGNRLAEDSGVVYEATTQHEEFKYDEWGGFDYIGFQGEKYFAGYSDDTSFDSQIKQQSLIDMGYISKVLINSDEDYLITTEAPLEMNEGYELQLKSADDKGIYVVLNKEGKFVEGQRVDIVDGRGSTYTYKKEYYENKMFITIAVHFRNHFSSGGGGAWCDGIFQISDEFGDLDQRIGKMTTKTANKNRIAMKNDENIELTKIKDINFMGKYWIKTADQDDSDENPLRFFIYRKEDRPGTYEIRSSLALVQNGEVSWNARNFPGFYFDLDNNIKTEEIYFSITEDYQLDKKNGIVYRTHPQNSIFSFKDWGNFSVIGFLGEKYFAGYSNDSYLRSKSDEWDLMKYERLSKVLIDSKNESTLMEGKTLWLGEGYKLTITSLDIHGNRAWIVLFKDGQKVDDAVVSPSDKNAELDDKTYYYKKDIERCNGIILIAVHFKNAFNEKGYNLVTIDGVWQISETSKDISEDQEYSIMKVRSIENGEITMVNIEDIPLRRRSLPLMEHILIKTSDDLNKEKRYFYICREDTVESIWEPGENDVIYYPRRGWT